MNEVSQQLQPSYTYHDKISESLSEMRKTVLESQCTLNISNILWRLNLVIMNSEEV